MLFLKKFFDKSYWIFSVLFSLYFLNIFVGKISLMISDRALPWGLNGVSEFLLLLFACIFFVIGILKAESS